MNQKNLMAVKAIIETRKMGKLVVGMRIRFVGLTPYQAENIDQLFELGSPRCRANSKIQKTDAKSKKKEIELRFGMEGGDKGRKWN